MIHPELSHAEINRAAANAEERYFGLSLTAWLGIAIIGLFMAATFRFNLWRLILKTNPITGEANWGHSMCVPLIGLWYLYVNRDQLLQQPVQPLLIGRMSRSRFVGAALCLIVGAVLWFGGQRLLPQSLLKEPLVGAGGGLMILAVLVAFVDWGLGLFLLGLAVFQYGIWPGRNDWISDVGMVITLFGTVLTLCGWRVMRIAWFPIVFLICAIPWPGLFYSKVAMPLQELAAKVAVGVLNVSGVDATQSGTKIFMSQPGRPDRALNVAEACAGMRSLMTFISVGGAVAFLSNRPLWQKLIIVFSAIPIAIFCNVMRVSGQGLLDHYVSEKWSESFAHQFVGLVMLMPAFFLILLVAWLLDQMFIEEHDEAATQSGDSSGRKVQPGILIARRNRAQQENA